MANSNPLALRPVGFVEYVFRLAKGDALGSAGSSSSQVPQRLRCPCTAWSGRRSPDSSTASGLANQCNCHSDLPHFSTSTKLDARCDPWIRHFETSSVKSLTTHSTNDTAPYVDFQTAPGTCISDGHFIDSQI